MKEQPSKSERKRLLIEMMKEDEKNGMYEVPDDELIAVFMGEKIHNYGESPVYLEGPGFPNEPPYEAEYQTSWDALMPVVEKINNKYQLWCQTKRFKEMDPIYRKLQNELIFCSINGVHEWCVEFIKFYNSQQHERK